MEKVLVHDDENEDVHYIKESFLDADVTLCGQRLQPISTTHVRKLDVTCKKCLKIAKRTGKECIKKLNCTFHELYHCDPTKQTYRSLIKMHEKVNELIKAVNELLKKSKSN
jgi:hypothetical protein